MLNNSGLQDYWPPISTSETTLLRRTLWEACIEGQRILVLGSHCACIVASKVILSQWMLHTPQKDSKVAADYQLHIDIHVAWNMATSYSSCNTLENYMREFDPSLRQNSTNSGQIHCKRSGSESELASFRIPALQTVLFHQEVSISVCCHCTYANLFLTVLKMQTMRSTQKAVKGIFACQLDLPYLGSNIDWSIVTAAFIIYALLPSSPGVFSMPLSRHVTSQGHAKCFSNRICRRTHVYLHSCN